IGDLRGSGQVSATTTGAFEELPVSWKARAEELERGITSPEELLAAAHSSCFSMALSGDLARRGARVERLDVSCAVSFDQGTSGYVVKSSILDVTAEVSEIDEEGFQAAA